MSLALKMMTRLATNLERDVARAEARANAGEDVSAVLSRLDRRSRLALRLVDLFARRAA